MQNFALCSSVEIKLLLHEKTSAVNAAQLNVVQGILICTKAGKFGRVSILTNVIFLVSLSEKAFKRNSDLQVFMLSSESELQSGIQSTYCVSHFH